MQKYLSVLLLIALSVTLVSCGGSPEDIEVSGDASKPAVVSEPMPTEPPSEAYQEAPPDEGPIVAEPRDLPNARTPKLFVEFPGDLCNTPDGMALMPDGSILVSAPNFNDTTTTPCILRVSKESEVSLFFTPPPHPDTGKSGPMGICVAPSGDVFVADNQYFHDKNRRSRVLRIDMEGDKPVGAVVVLEGMNLANAVAVREGYLYVTETVLLENTNPAISALYRFPADIESYEVRESGTDPHLVALMTCRNENVPFGADGMTFDKGGNCYIGNFGDGVIHKVTIDANGRGKSSEFAKADFMRCCDGIFYDESTERIYVADSITNAVQVVEKDGSVWTLALSPNNDGANGALDQPCEVLVREGQLIVSNMDWPVEGPGGTVNKTWDRPYTLSVIDLD